jgi:CHAT domain-containing protein
MIGFYEHWLRDADHPDKAEALRRAQRAVRTWRPFPDQPPPYEAPRFWAGVQLAGAS